MMVTTCDGCGRDYAVQIDDHDPICPYCGLPMLYDLVEQILPDEEGISHDLL